MRDGRYRIGDEVVLVGDSNAAMWSRAFQQVAEQRRWRLETLAKAACPLLNLRIVNPHLRASTPSASSGALRSSTGYGTSTRGWSC